MAFRPEVPVKPGRHLVTAGTCAEQGRLSFWLWPSSVNEAQLTFLGFSLFPVRTWATASNSWATYLVALYMQSSTELIGNSIYV